MNQYLSSASLKSLAKGQLLGKYGITVGAYLLQMLCTIPLVLATTSLIGTGSVGGVLLSSAADFLVSLFAGFFIAGQSYIYLKVACNQMPLISDLFHCFHGDTNKVIHIQAVIAGISTVCSLPALMVNSYMGNSLIALFSAAPASNAVPSASLFLLYTILYLAATIIDVFVRLLLSQVYYLMLDFPEYSAPELLKMSIRLMKGNKGRLFYIQLSFFPLIMLCMFSCGIGMLWLLPYMEATSANFYLDLVRKSKPTQAQ